MKKIISLIAFTAMLAVPVFAQTSANVRVNSLNALVQLPILSTNMSAMVSGNAAIGDGGFAGDFTYDSTSSADTNTYSVFKPAATTGRWIRRNEAAWNQFTAATANDGATYAFSLRRNLQTNVFNLGADNNNVYLQSQASYGLHLNNQGNNTIINGTAGNVGIGTLSPSVPLDVTGKAIIGTGVTSGNSLTVIGGSGNGLRQKFQFQAASGQYNWFISAAAAASQTLSIGASTATDGDTAATPVLNITQTGNVGIGTTGPTSLLSVAGAANAGTLVATNGITVGSVAAAQQVKAIYSGAAELDFGSIAANTVLDLTITVTGSGTNSTVVASRADGAMTASISLSGWVSATNTVTVRASNPTVGAIDPLTGSYRVTVFQY